MDNDTSKRNRIALAIGLVTLVAITSGTIWWSQRGNQNPAGHPPTTTSQQAEREPTKEYDIHQNIKATKFWVGESADASNRGIHNRSSAWRLNWSDEFGGLDDPNDRCNYLPCDFTPKENAFYIAVPYNDFDDRGKRKPSANQIYWHNPNTPKNVSLIKNHWVKITNGNKVVYGQVEDAGPYGEDDVNYVFGDDQPKEKDAGIDLSPAAADYVGLEGAGTEDGSGIVTWQFVDEKDVPDGPWKTNITRSNPD